MGNHSPENHFRTREHLHAQNCGNGGRRVYRESLQVDGIVNNSGFGLYRV